MMISKNWNCFTIGFNPEYETWNALRKKLFIKAEKGKDRLSFVSYKCSILRDPVNNKMLSFLLTMWKRSELKRIFLFKVKLSVCGARGRIIKLKKLLPRNDKLISLNNVLFFLFNSSLSFFCLCHMRFLLWKRSEKCCYGDLLIGLLCTSCIWDRFKFFADVAGKML